MGLGAALIGAVVAGWLALVTVSPALAEDTCVDAAPHDPSAVRGITWSGTVSGIRQTGVSEYGDEYWSITFAVDRVYAHDPTREFPAGAVLAAGGPFVLPNTTCTGNGALGMKFGGRYLVSASFVSDQGPALSELAIWRLDGASAAVLPGLYGTAEAPLAIASVRTLQEALELLGIEVPNPTAPPPNSPSVSATEATVPFLPFAALVALLFLGGVAAWWHRRHVTLRDPE